MRETDFIQQNKGKWQEFEKSLVKKGNDPEKLSELFIETTDDLSFSRTYYPNRSVRVYLNGIAQTVFQKLYKTNRSRRGGFRKYWLETLPDVMWHSRYALLLSFIIFSAAIAIGMWSAVENPDFVRIILGDGYVEMTEANIENDDPMAVYKNESPIVMFLRIMGNNIYVSFLCFLLGILAGAGTALALLSNGIMVGAFLMFFIQRDLMQESLLAVMLHGTIELSMIVLAGCAGFTLAKGLVFPKNFNRLQSLVVSARKGIVVMLGVSAFLVIAAAIESFATRHTETPDIVRFLLILASLGLVVGYFVVYPRIRYNRGLVKPEGEEELQAERKYRIRLNEIKSSGKIFTEIFAYFRTGASHYLRFALGLGLAAALTLWQTTEGLLENVVFDSWGSGRTPWMLDVVWVWNEVNNFVQFEENAFMYPALSILLGLALTQAGYVFHKRHHEQTKYSRYYFSRVGNAIIASFFLLAAFWLVHILSFIVIVLAWPILTLALAISLEENRFFFAAIGDAFRLLNRTYGRLLGLFFVLISVPWIICLFLSGPLWVWLFYIINMNIPASWPIADDLPFILYAFIAYFILAIGASLFMYGHLLFYHSVQEITFASRLKERIDQIGFKKRAYGLEKE